MYDRIIRVKRSKLYILETLVGIAILIALNIWLLPARPAFEGITPNPLWIIVLAMAGRYGRIGGLFAGVMVSAFFVIYYLVLQGIDAFYDNWWLLRFPFFFLLVGFLIGEIKTIFILREDYMSNRVEELENQNTNITKETLIIKEAFKGLTIDVATTTDTMTILNEIMGHLKSTDIPQIYRGLLESFRNYLEVEECSFYELEGNHLILKDKLGWKDYYRRPETHEVGVNIIGLAAKHRHTLSIKDVVLHRHGEKAKQSATMGDSLLAIPLIGLDERLYGVASIEKIPLLKLTDHTIKTTRIIADLAASALNTAYSFKMLEQKQIKEHDYDLFRYHYFLARLDEEFNRSLNYMLPLSLMSFKWDKIQTLEEQRRKILEETIITLVQSHLRSFDVLAKGPTAETPFTLLLATTSGPQAEDLKTKFLSRVKEYGFEGELTTSKLEDSIQIGKFDPNSTKSTQELLKLAGL